jgi:hypothetical protein
MDEPRGEEHVRWSGLPQVERSSGFYIEQRDAAEPGDGL